MRLKEDFFMKKISNLAILLIIISLLCSFFTFTASAASASISFSKSEINPGDQVTATITVNGSNMTGSDLDITYDQSILDYVTGADNGGSGLVEIVDEKMDELTTKSYTITFIARKAGSVNVSVSGYVSDGLPPQDAPITASKALSVVDKALSDNANLKSLTLTAGTLSPKFSPNTTQYTVNVQNSVTECKFYVVTEDSSATVDVKGSATLKVGTNTRTIVVTAPSGATKSYVITIIRSESENEEPVSSDETTSEETDDTPQPIEATVNNQNYIVETDISAFKMISGFTSVKTEFKGQEISVAVDDSEEYKIFYLKQAQGEEYILCTYNEETDTFEELKYLLFNNKVFIIVDIPQNHALPEEYYLTNITVDGVDFKCFTINDTNGIDFYYVYCFVDGHHSFYRYDRRENSFQRFPELKMTVSDDNSSSINNSTTANGILARFNSLSSNAKIVVIALIVIIICAIALLALLLLKIFGRRNTDFDEDIFTSDDDFDDISISNQDDTVESFDDSSAELEDESEE